MYFDLDSDTDGFLVAVKKIILITKPITHKIKVLSTWKLNGITKRDSTIEKWV